MIWNSNIPTNLALIVSAAFMLVSGVLSAQEAPMPLQDMINAALEANYDIVIYRNNQRQAENMNTIGNAGMLPRIDINGEQSFSIENSEQQFFTGDSQQADAARSESTAASAALTWVVFDGLAMFARKDRLEQLAQLGKTDTRYYIEQTAADLALAYYQMAQEQKLLTALRKTLDVSGARLALQEKRLEVGEGTQLDLQQARVDRNADSAAVLGQQVVIRELKIEMNRLMRRELSADIVVDAELSLNGDIELGAVMKGALEKNARLSQQQIREIIATEEVKIGRGAYFPEVELFGNYRFGRVSNEVGFLEASQSLGPNFGVRVRFNLFNGNQQRTQVQNAKIAVETEQIRTAQVEQEIRAAVQLAAIRWENALQQAKLESESVEEARSTLDIAQQQYELGTINDVEYRTIQLNALNAETRYLQAQFRARMHELELFRLSGQLMEQLL